MSDQDHLSTFDLTQLPTEEDDEFEFKSSRTPQKDLKKKMGCAASAFANSGGGYFVAGVDDKTANADGGIPMEYGRDLKAWTDQIIHGVQPVPEYHIKLIDDPAGRGTINPDRVVLVVRIEASDLAPHMGPEHRYYIRAGKHTVSARHFIVEALWAKRHFHKPRLTHVFRARPDYTEIIQLGIVALTDSPALNVRMGVTPIGEPPHHMRSLEMDSPLEIGVIDRHTPFFFDVTTRHCADKKEIPDIQLCVNYQDLAGNAYKHERTISVIRSLFSLRFFRDDKIEKGLESIQDKIP
jgi:hypothetical protein